MTDSKVQHSSGQREKSEILIHSKSQKLVLQKTPEMYGQFTRVGKLWQRGKSSASFRKKKEK